MAMEAPVASSRHNIFSEMPLSDFSRHGIFPVSTKSSSSFGAPSGSLTIVVPSSDRELRKIGRERMHPPRPVAGDDDGLGEHAAGLAVHPFRIEQVDVHGEHHAGLELVADRLQRALVGAERVVAVARIFQRSETMAVDAGLADAEAGAGDDVAHRIHRGGYFCARLEQAEAGPVGAQARLVDVEIAWLGLAQTEGALDVGVVAAELRMHLADDHVAF